MDYFRFEIAPVRESTSFGTVIRAYCVSSSLAIVLGVIRGRTRFRETRGSYPSSNFQQRRVFVAR